MNTHHPIVLNWAEDEQIWYAKVPSVHPNILAHGDTPNEAVENVQYVLDLWEGVYD